MKQLLHNLFLPLFAAALCSGACSDDDNDSRPKPSGYDIYTAGYKTPSGKSVATVWKNGSELYALTDGTNDAWAYSVFVDNGTVYAAGYEQQGDAIVGKIWVNGARNTPSHRLRAAPISIRFRPRTAVSTSPAARTRTAP